MFGHYSSKVLRDKICLEVCKSKYYNYYYILDLVITTVTEFQSINICFP